MPRPLGLRAWLLLAAAFVLPRLALLACSFGAYSDIQSYALVQHAMHAGQPLYANLDLAGRYPYLPAWAWTLQGLGRIGLSTGWPSWVLVKLPGLAAEAGMVWLLASGPGLAAALAYALCPVSWMVTAGHGQFDAVVLLLLLAPAMGWGRPGWRAGLAAGLWVGAAIAFKTWPVFLLPVFFRTAGDRRAGLGLLATALALPLLLVLPYVFSEGLGPVAAHLAYTGVPAVSLPEVLIQGAQRWFPGPRPGELWVPIGRVLLGLAWIGSWRSRAQTSPVRQLAGQALVLLFLAPAVSVQYLLWPLPFLASCNPRLAWRYSLLALGPALGFYLLWYPAAIDAAWPQDLVARTEGLRQFWIGLNLAYWLGLAWTWWDLGHGRSRPHGELEHTRIS